MKNLKFLLIFFVILALAFSIFFIFTAEKVQVFHPKGMIAKKELALILFNVALMLAILLPTLLVLLLVAWKYRANKPQVYEPKTYGLFNQTIIWLLPSIIVTIMAIKTWKETHHLDPYKRISSKAEELIIQVVALDWKWLFIYPEQGIATVNFVQFPEKKPIRFELTADGSPMNSFWIPQLSGQIYCMTGMVTPLHLIADEIGTYPGRAAEINGDGYAKMTFVAKSTSQEEFNHWVEQVKKSPLTLDNNFYTQLLKPSINHPVEFYSSVAKDLFKTIVDKP